MPKLLSRTTVLAMLAALPGAAWAAQTATPAAAAQDGVPAAMKDATAKIEAGDLAGAIAALEPLRRDPAAPAPALSLLGALYLQVQRPADALAVLEPLAAQAAAEPAVLYNAARGALALGRTPQAERYLIEAVRREPVSPAARLLGELRLSQGWHEEAYGLLRPWALAHPEDSGALLGAIFAALGDDRLAEAAELVGRLPPDDPRTILLRGRVERLQKKPEAVATLKPLIEGPGATDLAKRDPRLAADIGFEYAQALLLAGQKEEAVKVLARVTQLVGGHQPAWQMLGETLVDLGRVEEAHAALSRAQSLGEAQESAEREKAKQTEAAVDSADALIRQAFDLRREGKVEEALATLRSAVERAPTEPRIRIVEVRALLALGRPRDALPRAEELVALAPQNPDVLYLRGAARIALGDFAGAGADFRRVLELAPDNTAAMNDLAVVLMAEKKNAEAEKLLTRVLELRPDNPLAAKNLERLRGQGGGESRN